MAKKAEQVVNLDEVEAARKEQRMANNDSTILELEFNLEDMDDFEPLPDGEYLATVTLAEMRTSDKGNDYYYVTFQIDPNEFPADYAVENAPEGMNLTYARVQKPTPSNRRSITGVKRLMRALGLPLNTSVIDPSLWENRQAKLRLKKQDWNGEQINNIVSVEAVD